MQTKTDAGIPEACICFLKCHADEGALADRAESEKLPAECNVIAVILYWDAVRYAVIEGEDCAAAREWGLHLVFKLVMLVSEIRD